MGLRSHNLLLAIYKYGGSYYAVPFMFLFFLGLIICGSPSIEYYLGNADHAHQLAAGWQILLGRRLFVDLYLSHGYGPLSAYTSAIGLLIHNSLLPETIICSVGYALSLALFFAIARREAGVIIALFLVAAQYLLLGRFYKWYHWLFPLLTLLMLPNTRLSVRSNSKLIALGACCGLAYLYRFDMGVTCLTVSVLGLGIMAMGCDPLRSFLRRTVLVFAGFSGPVLTWLVALFSYGNMEGLINHFIYFFDTGDLISACSKAAPGFQWNFWQAILSYETAWVFLLWFMPLLVIMGVGFCLYESWRGRSFKLRSRQICILCAMALMFMPYGLYRADFPHFCMVMPFLSLASSAILVHFWHYSFRSLLARDIFGRLLVIVSCSLFCVATLAIGSQWKSEVRFFGRSVNYKFRLLLDGGLAVPDNYISKASRYIREHTTDDDTVLSLFNQPQILFFSRRRHAGYPIIYTPGIMTSEKWRRRNLERVVRDRPVFVVAMPGISMDNKVENLMENIQPELWDYVTRHYRPVALSMGSLAILARSDSGK